MLQLWIQYTAALPVWNKEENDENEEDDESDDGSLSGGPDDSLCGVRQKEAATSGQGGKIEYKLAYHLPADHPLAKGVESFIQKVKEKTHGEVTITAYPAGQLYNDKSMNDAIMTGGVDMGLNTVGRWATVVPAMEVFDVPFVFPSYEKIDQAIDGGMGRTLADELAKSMSRSSIGRTTVSSSLPITRSLSKSRKILRA